MRYYSQGHQLTIEEFKGALSRLPKDNRWVKLGDSLPWDRIEKVYVSKLKNEKTGAGNLPARVVIGALIIKHKMNLSDKETIEIIRENPYMQYMLGMSEYSDRNVFDPSLFVSIRKRLGVDDFNKFTECLLSAPRGEAQNDESDETEGDAAHNGTLKVDAACCDAEVRYPTDMDLLHDGLVAVERFLDRFCVAASLPRPRTNFDAAHAKYCSVIKKKVKQKKQLRSCMEYLIHRLLSNISLTWETIGKGKSDALQRMRRRDVNLFLTTIRMCDQQKWMFTNGVHRHMERIVSIFQPHIRPIVRGKAKAKVEFGAKIGAAIVDGYTFIDHHGWSAYNEAEDLLPHLRAYKRRYGCLPEVLEADRIYLNRRNRRILHLLKIKIGGHPLGRPSKNEADNRLIAKYIGERNEIEATFGTGKRVYKADDIRAKLPDTGAAWVGACFFVKNVMKFLRELYFALIRALEIHFLQSSFLNFRLILAPTRYSAQF